MGADAEGYVTAIAYPVQHHPDLEPVGQAFALLQRGLAPPNTSGPFRYLDLGCGAGFSLAAHAAVLPHASFLGIDINPEHIAFLAGLAADAKLDNLTARQTGFADFTADQPGGYDFIVAHGIWSWVSAENRLRATRIIGEALAPGGVFQVSYNCLPGLAAIEPLRRLLLATPHLSEDLNQAIGEAVAFARRAEAAGAAFLSAEPVRERLMQIAGAAPGYLAHEYFNRDWTAFYHGDVARALSGIGLSFAAASRHVENVPRGQFSPEQLSLIAEVTDPAEQETLKDFLTNRTFRSDLFILQRKPLSQVAVSRQLARTRFAYVCPPGAFPAGAPHRYVQISQAVAKAPATLSELPQRPEINRSIPQEDLQAIVLELTAMGVLAPALPAAGERVRAERARRFNRAVATRVAAGQIMPGYVSPVTGSVLSLNPEEMSVVAARFGTRDATRPQVSPDLLPLLNYLQIID